MDSSSPYYKYKASKNFFVQFDNNHDLFYIDLTYYEIIDFEALESSLESLVGEWFITRHILALTDEKDYALMLIQIAN